MVPMGEAQPNDHRPHSLNHYHRCSVGSDHAAISAPIGTSSSVTISTGVYGRSVVELGKKSMPWLVPGALNPDYIFASVASLNNA